MDMIASSGLVVFRPKRNLSTRIFFRNVSSFCFGEKQALCYPVQMNKTFSPFWVLSVNPCSLKRNYCGLKYLTGGPRTLLNFVVRKNPKRNDISRKNQDFTINIAKQRAIIVRLPNEHKILFEPFSITPRKKIYIDWWCY